MTGLIDLHNHALFGVDDGAQTVEVCMQMIGAAYKTGVRAICFTPHYNPSAYRTDAAAVYAAYERVCAISSRQFPDLALLLGNEIYSYADGTGPIEEGKCRSLAGGRAVLVEFSPHIAYREMKNRFLAFVTAGYTPILAHAERYACLFGDVSRIEELVNMRVLIQVNAESVLRFFHFRTYRFVHALLSRRLVHILASDMHTLKDAPLLAHASRAVARRYGQAYATRISHTNPKRILLRK